MYLQLCSNCSKPGYKTSSSFKVFTFKNPYLGNTCVPFQHWACSLQCARAVGNNSVWIFPLIIVTTLSTDQ